MECIYCQRINEKEVTVCSKCGKDILSIVNIEDLHYEVVSQMFSEDLKNVKVGFFSKGNLNKIVNSIKEGTCEYVKVKVQDKYEVDVGDSEDIISSYDTYIRILTLDEHPISHDIKIPSINSYLPSNDEIINLFRIKIKNKYRYILLKEVSIEYIMENIKNILYVTSNEIRKRKSPDIFDKTFQKISDVFKK